MKWQPYPGYKPSGVEWLREVPNNWPVTRLRFRAKINPSKAEINGVSGDTMVSFVPMEAVAEYGGLRLDQAKLLDEVANGYTYFREGDVVVAKITPCFENWKGSVAQGLENGLGFGTTELHVIRPADDLDRRYLFYLTITHAFRSIGASYMYGAGGQKRVPDDFVRNFRHPFPPREEQSAIASFLDRETGRIDALMEKKRRQIDLLQEKRTALISHAVTKGLNRTVPLKDSAIEWMGQIPAHWELGKLKHITSSIQTGPFGSQLHAGEYVEDGIPAINPSNLKNGTIVPDWRCCVNKEIFARLSRHRLDEGDIVFARRGEMGRCALVTREEDGWLCGTGSIRIRLNKGAAYPPFVYQVLSTPGIRDWLFLESVGSTMDNLNTEIMSQIPILLPPLDEQIFIVGEIEKHLQQIDNLKTKIQKSIDRLKEYRTALISSAVTGQIDVREAGT